MSKTMSEWTILGKVVVAVLALGAVIGLLYGGVLFVATEAVEDADVPVIQLLQENQRMGLRIEREMQVQNCQRYERSDSTVTFEQAQHICNTRYPRP